MMESMGMPGPTLAFPVLSALLAGVVAFALLLALAQSRVPALTASGPRTDSKDSGAVVLAKERYARGDIDHATLERILSDLLRAEGRGGSGGN
ncbi:SHOCT domain-containing protein [Allosalinactinospora lopnorensis]|uniref:hypothetical protein n=1 Tax=Allosalinactinospora lopnorensis TaxID=1352348 RepID=UPI0012E325AD|nr:hypothetical protein [Allosalinactinospora lopnorensis]